jgi:predicted transglutaminase-like cysteine proteinase
MLILQCSKYWRRGTVLNSLVIACLIVGYGMLVAAPSLAKLPLIKTPFSAIEGALSVRAIALKSTSPFRKWRTALARTQAASARSSFLGQNQWQAIISRIGALPAKKRLGAVNDAFNRITYRKDKDTWGQTDYWTSPQELLSRGQGDCEDYALAKYFTLRALGYAADQLLILTYRDLKINAGHTVLMVREGNKWVVLDNRRRLLMPLAYYAFNKPIYLLNESNAWWLTRQA